MQPGCPGPVTRAPIFDRIAAGIVVGYQQVIRCQAPAQGIGFHVTSTAFLTMGITTVTTNFLNYAALPDPFWPRPDHAQHHATGQMPCSEVSRKAETHHCKQAVLGRHPHPLPAPAAAGEGEMKGVDGASGRRATCFSTPFYSAALIVILGGSSKLSPMDVPSASTAGRR